MAPRYAYGDDGPDGAACFRIWETALPCAGVALRLSTVIDCRPGEDRMPPVTIDFLKSLPPHQGDAALQVAGRFTCDCGDFVFLIKLQRVEEMVAAAGLPPECVPSVKDFLYLSASNAANSFYKAMAITVEAGVDEDEDEEVPAGADAGECAICYREYLIGGATSVRPPCGHTFHRRCLDRWTSVKRTCPYCRAPVPEEHDFWDGEDDDDYDAEHDGGDDLPPGEEEHLSFSVPGGETPSADAVSDSEPTS
ncbi:hypothetical protein BAE44_0011821 [Dichanthelium oligosanthes]|uniref:RING-type domain-containing protein n=1 Tax=Dichanthelium oligosanthes TaxID=888268 RepID=A0A1E5VPT6_9POAL|nr:hypothetical protein BAE44_0011821 [Dichanthelium oligosanthes]